MITERKLSRQSKNEVVCVYYSCYNLLLVSQHHLLNYFKSLILNQQRNKRVSCSAFTWPLRLFTAFTETFYRCSDFLQEFLSRPNHLITLINQKFYFAIKRFLNCSETCYRNLRSSERLALKRNINASEL